MAAEHTAADLGPYGGALSEWAGAVEHAPTDAPAGDLDTLAALNYTGGTTGLPKGCEHTQRHMLDTAATSAAATRQTTETGYVALCYIPIFWIAGEDLGVLNPLVLGGTSVLLPRWDAGEVLAAIDTHGVTTMVGTVENYLELLEHPDFAHHDMSSLTDPMAVSFVRKLTPDVRHRCAEAAGPHSLLREGAYGMTETHTFDATPYGLTEDDRDRQDQEGRSRNPRAGTRRPPIDSEAGPVVCRQIAILRRVLVLLPPSETKAAGGEGPPLDLAALSFPALNPVRRKVADALVELARDMPASLAALGLSERQSGEVERNAELYTSPTMPALGRYTGVLYDALDTESFTTSQRRRAAGRLTVASALFGLLAADDPIPPYRLSGNSTLPALGSLRNLWRPTLEPLLADRDDLVVDLRSGAYAGLARVPGAVTVRVVTADAAGVRKTVSHHNKAYKGKLAAVLATSRTEPSTVDEVLTVASRAGLAVERTGEHTLELLTGG